MNIDMIIRDLQDIIFYAKQASSRACENRKDAERNLSNAENGDFPSDAYYTVSEGLVDAANSLDKAHEDLDNVVEMLSKVIDELKFQQLSHKVQSK